jgi:hypothetical protein
MRDRLLKLCTSAATAFPPPLWGRDREGGKQQALSSLRTPLPTLPHKGGGSERPLVLRERKSAL